MNTAKKFIISKKEIDEGGLEKILKDDYDYIIFERGIYFGYIISLKGLGDASYGKKAISELANNDDTYYTFNKLIENVKNNNYNYELTVYIPDNIFNNIKNKYDPKKIFARDVMDKVYNKFNVMLEIGKINIEPAKYTGVSEMFSEKIQEVLDKWLSENK